MVIPTGNFTTINSESMKIVLAYYYRFHLRYLYTCTEFQYMDVVACNGSYTVEIECKISKADLKNERKKPKHKIYRGDKKSRNRTIPNIYYVAIPYRMWLDKECEKIISNLNDSYGIMVIYENNPIPEIVKHPKKLHNKKISQKNLERIIMRLSSENIGLRKKLYDLKTKKSTE